VSGLDAALQTCAVLDRSDLGRLLATGPDLLALLHRLSTGDVKSLAPGEGRETVITNAKGRIVERLFVHHLGNDGVLLVSGPGGSARVLVHLKKFTFAENTGLADITESTFAAALLGPRYAECARTVGIPELAPYATASVVIAATEVHVVRTNGFDADGVLVIGPKDGAGSVVGALTAAVAAVSGSTLDAEGLESWRILKGLPASGHELTEDYNPLEAGLRNAISFTKGCYVGQEVVARLNTYDKVSRALVRLDFAAGTPTPAVGAPVLVGGVVAGAVTSAILPDGRTAPVALAYVKTRELGDATKQVDVDMNGVPRTATIARI
jgi:folate-binding protein YgfZ